MHSRLNFRRTAFQNLAPSLISVTSQDFRLESRDSQFRQVVAVWDSEYIKKIIKEFLGPLGQPVFCLFRIVFNYKKNL